MQHKAMMCYTERTIVTFQEHDFYQSLLFYFELSLSISCLPNPLNPSLNSSLPKRRSRNTITLQHRPINTNRNTLIGSLVKLCSFNTSRISSALARDLEIDAVGVVLGSIGLVCTVQGDDFVAQHVGASDYGGRDGDGPGVVVCDERVRGPCAVGLLVTMFSEVEGERG